MAAGPDGHASTGPQAINADETPVEWRLVIEGLHAAAPRRTSSSPAARRRTDGNTGGDEPPKLAAYDVANTDFFADLDDYAAGRRGLRPDRAAQGDRGRRSRSTRSTRWCSPTTRCPATRAATAARTGAADRRASRSRARRRPSRRRTSRTPTGAGEPRARVPGSYETVEFEVGAREAAQQVDDGRGRLGRLRRRLRHVPLPRRRGRQRDLRRQLDSTGGEPTRRSRSARPTAGALQALRRQLARGRRRRWTGAVTFEGFTRRRRRPARPAPTPTAEKDAWIAQARASSCEGGGNLVLTDGALQALPDLVPGIDAPGRRRADRLRRPDHVRRRRGRHARGPARRGTSSSPARASTRGMRRQTFEPTPLGFAIQDAAGADAVELAASTTSTARAWEAAGGRYVAGSADQRRRATPQPLTDRVTVGEIDARQGPDPDRRRRCCRSRATSSTTRSASSPTRSPTRATSLARNLLDWRNPDRADPTGGAGPGGRVTTPPARSRPSGTASR